jgi:P27 family predicted phage terminase small subunit
MARGRRNKPAAVKRLQGNPGKRKLKADPAPMREGAVVDDGKSVALFPVPKPPAYLSKKAKAEWLRLAPWMRQQGLLRDADLALFEQRCCIVAEIQDDMQALARHGGSDYEHKGLMRQRPEVKRIEANRRQLRAIDSEFGLTPAARARVTHVTAGDDQPKQPALPGTTDAAAPAQADQPKNPLTIPDDEFARGPGALH